jgi:hypothetical protein
MMGGGDSKTETLAFISYKERPTMQTEKQNLPLHLRSAK